VSVSIVTDVNVQVGVNGPDTRCSMGESQWHFCYRNVFLTQKLLAIICKISGEFVVFQQDKAPAFETVSLVE